MSTNTIVQEHDSMPSSTGIASVNSRGASSSGDMHKKLLFFAIVAIALVMVGIVGFNKWRSAVRERDAAVGKVNKDENKSAAVAQRRKFDADNPPTTPTPTAKPADTTVGTGPCATGDIGKPVTGQDGKPLLSATGAPIRACKDGHIYVPAVALLPGETIQPVTPAPMSSTSNGSSATTTTAGGTPPPSRYAGDALVPSPQNLTSPEPSRQDKTVDSALGAITKALTGSSGGGYSASSPNPYSVLSGNDGGGSGAGGGSSNASQTSQIGALLNNSPIPSVSATRIGNRSMILPKGRSIDCSLSTRIINEVSGMATCVLARDVYSDNGRVVLFERGSEAVGEYTAQMAQGQRRLFVLWTRVKTPEGVVININSPAADGLGTSGIDGYVDNRWVDRIGAAFLLSVVQDAIAYQTAKDSAGGIAAQNAAANTTETGNKMAEKILDSTINIRPTLYKNQGDRASIFVARDLDFGTVYALKQR
jgi:type IV secretion system protein VirB10